MNSTTTVTVVVADDHQLVRGGFAALIDAEPDLEVVAQATDGHEAVDQTRRTRPDVVLMDIRMPGLDGIAATQQITNDPHLSATKVLVLTTFDLDQYVYAALRANASGFLLKDTAPQQLVDAIRVVAAGDALIAPSITRRLISQFVARPTPDDHKDQLDQLTDREGEVLVEIARGHTNNEIADHLHMSPLTAKTHVSRILSKLAARDRTQLVVIAYETGLIAPGEHP